MIGIFDQSFFGISIHFHWIQILSISGLNILALNLLLCYHLLMPPLCLIKFIHVLL